MMIRVYAVITAALLSAIPRVILVYATAEMGLSTDAVSRGVWITVHTTVQFIAFQLIYCLLMAPWLEPVRYRPRKHKDAPRELEVHP